MKQIFLMRGLPGSGKSYWVIQNSHDAYIICADFLRYIDGVYTYNPKTDHLIHDKVFFDYTDLVIKGTERIFVDNTNTTLNQIAPFYRVGEIYNYQIKIIQMITPLHICIQRNTHKVPHKTMLKMAIELQTEKLLPHYDITLVDGSVHPQ